MEKNEFSNMVEVFDGDETNLNSKLLDFLNKATLLGKTNRPITSNLGIAKDSLKIYNLLNKGEYIRTCANEVPREDGGWSYNDDRMYEFYYILLEDNNLLIVQESTSIDNFSGDPYFIKFLLYPNADQFVIRTKYGHREDLPYTNIVNQNGELISTFSFEISFGEQKDLNGLSLYEAITPISIDYLASNIGGRK